MNLTSLEFVLFLLVVMPLNWCLRPFKTPYKLFLLLASYIFYASFNIKFILILAVFSFLTWFFAIIFSETRDRLFRRFCMVLYLSFSLGILVFFKYYEMIYISIDRVLTSFGAANPVPLMDVILPIGISFFTFQGLSYAIDAYRDERKVVRNPVDIFVFIAFFPTILSGPILRAGNFLPQLRRETVVPADFNRAFYLLISGLFKKIVISSYLSEHIVRQVFAAPESFSSVAVLVGVLSYSIQIYCDFSGYTDLAQGVGLLLGFNIPDNFNAPYASQSLRDFWRRWHITFSTWLRDYLYIPLGGNRKGVFRKYSNLMITMALGGLWHGAAYNFLIWGLIHGFGLVVFHLTHDAARAGKEAPEPFFSGVRAFSAWAFTFCYVTLAWIFFGAESAGKAVEIIRRMAAFDPEGSGYAGLCVFLIILIMFAQIFRITGKSVYDRYFTRLPAIAQGLVLGCVCIVIMKFGPDGVLPFIYFQF
jgi:alginate O-acetyltransferase complex protein AlgI